MNCPVCGYAHNNVIMKFDNIVVRKCERCSHEFSEHQVNIDFGIYDEVYYDQEHKKWFENPNYNLFGRIFSTIIRFFDNKEISIFDIGCGKGDFLRYMKAKGFTNLTGIDLSPNEYEEGIHFIKDDIFELDDVVTYDCVVNLAVIEHLNNLTEFVSKLESFVKPGGLLIIMTVDSDSFLYKMSKYAYKFGVSFPVKRLYSKHHVNHFNRASLRALVNQREFEVIEHINTNFPYKAVDVDQSALKPFILALIWIIFKFTETKGTGVLQTLIVRRKND